VKQQRHEADHSPSSAAEVNFTRTFYLKHEEEFSMA
jgi:hypothetical protein